MAPRKKVLYALNFFRTLFPVFRHLVCTTTTITFRQQTTAHVDDLPPTTTPPQTKWYVLEKKMQCLLWLGGKARMKEWAGKRQRKRLVKSLETNAKNSVSLPVFTINSGYERMIHRETNTSLSSYDKLPWGLVRLPEAPVHIGAAPSRDWRKNMAAYIPSTPAGRKCQWINRRHTAKS